MVLNLGHSKKGNRRKEKKKEIPISVCEPLNYRPGYGSVQCLSISGYHVLYCMYRVPFLKMLRIQEHYCSLHEYR